MEFSLSRLQLRPTGLSLFENWLEILRNEPFRSRSGVKKIFHWNCGTQKGHPAQPLKPFLAHSHLAFHVLGRNGKPDVKAEGQMLDRWVAASGLRTRKAFSKAFDRLLPSLSFPINEAKLIEPFKRNYVFNVTGFAVHNHFVVRANGGRPRDFAYLSVPWHVYLQTEFVRACNDAEKPVSGLLASDAGEPPLNELQKKLNRQHKTDSDEAMRRYRDH